MAYFRHGFLFTSTFCHHVIHSSYTYATEHFLPFDDCKVIIE